MSLTDGLSLLGVVYRSVLRVLTAIQLFNIPLGIYFIGAFTVKQIMKLVFNIQQSDAEIKARDSKAGSKSD